MDTLEQFHKSGILTMNIRRDAVCRVFAGRPERSNREETGMTRLYRSFSFSGDWRV